jgi:hypothetical protein
VSCVKLALLAVKGQPRLCAITVSLGVSHELKALTGRGSVT